MPGARLVVGLDYGTTYTGVSFCEVSNDASGAENIDVIHDWPSQHSKIGTRDKVPSEIAYTKGSVLWGSLIPPNTVRHMWTKLQLNSQPTGQAAKVKQEVSKSAEGGKKDPVDVVADFLKQVKDHLVKNLDQRYSKALWTSLPMTLVVTFPAVWSDLAKSRTFHAVREAGFNAIEFPQLQNIVMATEPECAAIYTIKTIRSTLHDTDLSVGDGFTICDMGGGTVDLISYRVTSLNPIRVEEASVGNGDQCGGAMVDRAFLQWLEKRLGTDDFRKIAGCRSEEVPFTSLTPKAARMMQDFNLEVKCGFSRTETSYIRLPLPVGNIEKDTTRGIFDGEIRLEARDITEMFDGPVRRTYELITEQLKLMKKHKNTRIKFIFMVGGFSESGYVFSKIKEFFEATNDLIVLRPVFAWSAVARGAAVRGIEMEDSSITQRKCRRHYGTSISTPFDASLHEEHNAFICQYTLQKMANFEMSWLLKKGQDLSTAEKAHAKVFLCKNFWPGKTRSLSLELLSADCGKAPKCSNDWAVYTVAMIKVDLSVVPDAQFERLTNSNGDVYFELSFWIEISIQSTIEYSLWVNGKKYGSLAATYK